MEAEEVLVETYWPKFMQELVASGKFYPFSSGRFDSVLVENDLSLPINGNDVFETSMRFAKDLMFVAISFSSDLSQIMRRKCNENRELKVDSKLRDLELCFVQLYERVNRNILKFDKINEVLSCIRLWWQKTPGEENLLSVAREYSLILIDSLHGLMHVFSTDSCITRFGYSWNQEQPSEQLYQGIEEWEAEQFYVNIFYFFRSIAYWESQN